MQRDTDIFDLIKAEKKRQANGIELIASENFTSDIEMNFVAGVPRSGGLQERLLLRDDVRRGRHGPGRVRRRGGGPAGGAGRLELDGHRGRVSHMYEFYRLLQ